MSIPTPIDELVGDPDVFSPYYSFNCWDEVLDPGAGSALEKFVLASMDLYPADNYMLILSGHGTGIDESDGYTDGAKSVIPNIAKRTEIRMPELKRVMDSVTSARPLAILAYEACYMGMFETAWQVRGANIGYILASEATVARRLIHNDKSDPSVIPEMADGSLVDPATVAARIVADYSGNTLAALDMGGKSGRRRRSTTPSPPPLRSYSDIDAIRSIVARCQKANGSAIGSYPYIYEYYFDLRDFCHILAESGSIVEGALKAAASALYENLAPGAGGFISAFRKKGPGRKLQGQWAFHPDRLRPEFGLPLLRIPGHLPKDRVLPGGQRPTGTPSSRASGCDRCPLLLERYRNAYNHTHGKNTKSKTNVSIDAELLAKAREFGNILSPLLEEAIQMRLRQDEEKLWLAENSAATESYNRGIQEHGVFSEGLRSF